MAKVNVVKRKGVGIKKAFNKTAAKIGKTYSVEFKTEEVAQYMFFNEYGTKDIPERAFFRTALRKARRKIAKQAVRGAKKPGRPSMKLASIALMEAVQLSILDWSSPRNAPSTIRKKGFNDPLIDTGRAYDDLHIRRIRNRKKI